MIRERGRGSIRANGVGWSCGRLRSAAAVAAALTLLALTGCASRPAVEVGLVGLAPVDATLFEQRLRLDLRLVNYGQRPIVARGFEVALNVNGQRLASGVDGSGFEVGPLSEARTSVVVSTSLFDVARQFLAIQGRERFSYELSGRVHVDGWVRSLPFRKSGEISRADLERLAGGGGRSPRPLRLE